MFCHGPYAGGAWAMVVSGRRVVHCRRPPRHGSFLPVRLHSGLPAAGPPAAEPCFARNARARPCARFAAARPIAPAHAREGRTPGPLGSPFGAVSWNVMFCHGPYAGGAWAMVVSGRRVVHCRRPPRHGSLLSIRLHSGLPAAEPCFARNVRARPCARFAAARLIAPARAGGGRRAHVSPRLQRCFFRAGAKREAARPRGCRSSPPVPILSWIFRSQALWNRRAFRSWSTV